MTPFTAICEFQKKEVCFTGFGDPIFCFSGIGQGTEIVATNYSTIVVPEEAELQRTSLFSHPSDKSLWHVLEYLIDVSGSVERDYAKNTLAYRLFPEQAQLICREVVTSDSFNVRLCSLTGKSMVGEDAALSDVTVFYATYLQPFLDRCLGILRRSKQPIGFPQERKDEHQYLLDAVLRHKDRLNLSNDLVASFDSLLAASLKWHRVCEYLLQRRWSQNSLFENLNNLNFKPYSEHELAIFNSVKDCFRRSVEASHELLVNELKMAETAKPFGCQEAEALPHTVPIPSEKGASEVQAEERTKSDAPAATSPTPSRPSRESDETDLAEKYREMLICERYKKDKTRSAEKFATRYPELALTGESLRRLQSRVRKWRGRHQVTKATEVRAKLQQLKATIPEDPFTNCDWDLRHKKKS